MGLCLYMSPISHMKVLILSEFTLRPSLQNPLIEDVSQIRHKLIVTGIQYRTPKKIANANLFLNLILNYTVEHSNHLNTKHQKYEHLTFPTLFCPVFKWSNQVMRGTFQKLDIFDHETEIFCPVFRLPYKNQTI